MWQDLNLPLDTSSWSEEDLKNPAKLYEKTVLFSAQREMADKILDAQWEGDSKRNAFYTVWYYITFMIPNAYSFYPLLRFVGGNLSCKMANKCLVFWQDSQTCFRVVDVGRPVWFRTGIKRACLILLILQYGSGIHNQYLHFVSCQRQNSPNISTWPFIYLQAHTITSHDAWVLLKRFK